MEGIDKTEFSKNIMKIVKNNMNIIQKEYALKKHILFVFESCR